MMSGQSPAGRVLDRSFLHSIAWTGSVKWVAQLATWLTTFIVARLLTPTDYGLVMMAAVFIGLVTLVSEAGLTVTIVTLRDLSRSQVAQLNGLAVVVGGVATLGGFSAALPLGRFYQAPALPSVVVALSLTVLLTSFRIVPLATLQRDLRFKPLALVEGAQNLVQAGSTVLLAWLGYGAWSLVAGALMGHALATVATLAVRREPYEWPAASRLTQALTFTRHQLTSGVAWYLYITADLLIAGRLLGPAVLGVYTIAWTLARTLPEKITALVLKVTPAFFSAVQDDPAELRRYLLRLTEYLSMVTVPALVGLALVADDVIRILGPQWSDAVLPTRLLALFAAYESLLQLQTRVLTARRRTRFLMYDGLAVLVVMVAALVVGSNWGAAGLAATWLIVHPWTRIPTFVLTCREINLSYRAYMKSWWPALSGTGCMAAAVLVTQQVLPYSNPAMRLGIFIGVGFLTYAVILVTFHQQRLRSFAAAVRHRQGRHAPAWGSPLQGVNGGGPPCTCQRPAGSGRMERCRNGFTGTD
jgi:teichuronic acid exporter